MQMLPFGSLPAYKPRRFVPLDLNLGDWTRGQPLFDQLETRAGQCRNGAELEARLLDWSELSAALDEEGSKRYVAMTCHNEDPEAEKAYLHFVEAIEPQAKPRQFQLERIYVVHPARKELPSWRYRVFDRDVVLRVELFRPENVPLETEEPKLGQQYQKLSGSLTVEFQGEERTLFQMGRYLEEPDRRHAGFDNCRDYKAALQLGGSPPLPDLFAAAGCRFDFSRETVAPLMKRVHQELLRLQYSPDSASRAHV